MVGSGQSVPVLFGPVCCFRNMKDASGSIGLKTRYAANGHVMHCLEWGCPTPGPLGLIGGPSLLDARAVVNGRFVTL